MLSRHPTLSLGTSNLPSEHVRSLYKVRATKKHPLSGLLMFFLVTTPVDPVQRGARGMGVDVLPMLPVIVLLRALCWAPSQADGYAQPPANPALAPPPDHLPAQCRRLAD